MKKIKTYKTFESHILPDDAHILPDSSMDVNYEEKIDKIIEELLKKKVLVSMLKDTIFHVCETIKKTLPQDSEGFINDVYHYDDNVYGSLSNIYEVMIEGYPNIKDTIENVEKEFELIENFMKLKKESNVKI